jgi:hypothetical protein
MTDRYSGFVVVLSNDTRDDDAAAIQTALSMVQGVARVEPVVSSPGAGAVMEMQVRSKLATELFTMGRKLLDGEGT